ncbi:MAG TPA: hypothetical protein EYO81_03865 [Gammaproteobacteria bacterium]|jgi:hypothetical protein|nr:hypothetical protein [Gammaproteobacteria bacterium]
MKHRILEKAEGHDAFTDLLFNSLLGFAFMFAIAFMLISDPSEGGKIESKAEILISIRWPDQHPDDVDAIVESPGGDLVWYHNRDTGLMHLDRDDRGLFADRMNVDGAVISNPINQETVTIRALQPGEYVVNLLHYQAHYDEPLTVDVKVEKLNPEVELIYYGSHELDGVGDEETAVRFSVDSQKNISNVNQMPKRLLTKALGRYPLIENKSD